jgi:hypothetical protein
MMLLAPLTDRAGHVGGIESISIDDKRWYFGFDYSSNLVVSPLIDDAAQMAGFAAQHMEHPDGPQEAAYWQQLVDWSAADSDLSGDPETRSFTGAELARIAADIDAALAGNQPVPGLTLPHHLLSLLSAAVGDVPPPGDAAYRAAMAKLGLYEDDMPINGACEAVDMLSGERALPDGATYTDAAALLRVCLAALVDRAPGNWRSMFQALVGA